MKPPIIKDKESWVRVIIEHRRNLLERVIEEFPEVKTTKRFIIEELRRKIK
jgi:hypothetical protein